MRKMLLSSVLILLVGMVAMAQEFPQAEFFGGYSYDRVGGGNYNGWIASIVENTHHMVGVKGEVSGHYLTTTNSFGKSENSLYHMVIGPQFAFRKSEKMTPFFHVMVGATNRRFNTTPASAPQTDSHTMLAVVAGGGFDYNVTRGFAIRIFQADYLLNRYQGESINNFRFSCGAVVRFAWRR
jgi:hypothetical protein